MKLYMNLFVAVASVVGGIAPVSATVIDSSTFAYRYEMNVDPTDVSKIDLDANNAPDLLPWTYNGGSITISSGILTIDGAGSKYAGYDTNSGTAGAIWQTSGGTISSGYEIEARIRINSSTGKYGACAIAAQPGPVGQATDGALLFIGSTGESWGGEAGATTNTVLGTEDNSDFHTYRIAALPGGGAGAYSVWRDGLLLASGLDAGAKGNSAYTPLFQVGAVASATHGVMDIDYIRFTPIGPAVPEPSAAILVSMAIVSLLAYAWKLRR